MTKRTCNLSGHNLTSCLFYHLLIWLLVLHTDTIYFFSWSNCLRIVCGYCTQNCRKFSCIVYRRKRHWTHHWETSPFQRMSIPSKYVNFLKLIIFVDERFSTFPSHQVLKFRGTPQNIFFPDLSTNAGIIWIHSHWTAIVVLAVVINLTI